MMKRERGFTILEAMIALTILAIGILALLRTMPVGLTASGRAHDVTVATLLAQQRMEETRAVGYPGIATTDGTFTTPNDNFDWEIDVIACAIANVREVSCSIYWPAAAGSLGARSKQRCVNMITYMANY